MKAKRKLSIKLSLNPSEVIELQKVFSIINKVHSGDYDEKQYEEIYNALYQIDGEFAGQLLDMIND